jgi:N,N'-diacetyllegionaminate synthase
MIQLKSGRTIGGKDVFIVGEISSNWRTLNDCLVSINLAANAGAHAVKFQLFSPKDLYGTDAPFEVGISPYLDPAWLPYLKEKADKAGIEFMCTSFSPERAREVDKYVEVHKVASAELSHLRLLQQLRKLGKPVILSTGASGFADVDKAVAVLTDTTHSDHAPVEVVLMHCVSAYPAPATNLARIQVLKQRFGRLVGYSDHSTNYDDVPLMAKLRGAAVIEKHLTCFPEIDSPDRPHSVTVAQFKRMVEYLGEKVDVPGYLEEEREMVLKHNRRLKVTRDVQPGEVLEEGVNVGAYRSLEEDAHALSGFMVDAVAGKPAKRAMGAGEGVGPGDF